MYLSKKTFRNLVKHAPLVAIDLVLTDKENKILLGERKNKPAKGKWFVPGGRIRKNETVRQAIRRILREEAPFVRAQRGRLLGIFEHFYRVHASGNEFGTHYIVLAYHLPFQKNNQPLLSAQHRSVHFLSARRILRHPRVHQNVKAYARQILCKSFKVFDPS